MDPSTDLGITCEDNTCEEKDGTYDDTRYSSASNVTCPTAVCTVLKEFHLKARPVTQEKVAQPWFVVDDPAATQFSLQSSVLQMQAKTVCVEKE